MACMMNLTASTITFSRRTLKASSTLSAYISPIMDIQLQAVLRTIQSHLRPLQTISESQHHSHGLNQNSRCLYEHSLRFLRHSHASTSAFRFPRGLPTPTLTASTNTRMASISKTLSRPLKAHEWPPYALSWSLKVLQWPLLANLWLKAIVSSDGLAWKWYQWIDDMFLVFPEQIFF